MKSFMRWTSDRVAPWMRVALKGCARIRWPHARAAKASAPLRPRCAPAAGGIPQTATDILRRARRAARASALEAARAAARAGCAARLSIKGTAIWRRGKRKTHASLMLKTVLSQPSPSRSARTGASCGNWASISARASSASTTRSGAHGSGPRIGRVVERAALRLDDAEALPGGRLHHPPGLDEGDARGAQRLEPLHLRLHVVGLDVEVDAARMRHFLHQELRLLRRGLQVQVDGIARGGDGAAQRGAPEAAGLVEVVRLAVDDEGGEAALVHGRSLLLLQKFRQSPIYKRQKQDGSYRLSYPLSAPARRPHHAGADRGGSRPHAAERGRPHPQARGLGRGDGLRRPPRSARAGQRHPRLRRRAHRASATPRRLHPAHPADPGGAGVPPGGRSRLLSAQSRRPQHRGARPPALRHAATDPGRHPHHHHHRPRGGEGDHRRAAAARGGAETVPQGAPMITLSKRMSPVQASAIRELLKLTELPEVLSFAGGLPAPEAFPVEALARAHAHVLAHDGASALQYGATEGFGPLRAWIAERMTKRRLPARAENVLVTAGSQQGIDLVAKALIDPGDVVILEEPSYLAALQAFSSYQAQFVVVGSDGEGMRVEELEEALRRTGAKLVYLVPNFQNPRCTTLSLDLRVLLTRLASEQGVAVLEDDPYGELRYSGAALPPVAGFDAQATVIHLGSFSKTLAPGLRIGFAVADERIIRALTIAKQAADLHTGGLAQRAVLRLLETFDYDAHLRRLRQLYGERCAPIPPSLDPPFPPAAHWTPPQG